MVNNVVKIADKNTQPAYDLSSCDVIFLHNTIYPQGFNKTNLRDSKISKCETKIPTFITEYFISSTLCVNNVKHVLRLFFGRSQHKHVNGFPSKQREKTHNCSMFDYNDIFYCMQQTNASV